MRRLATVVGVAVPAALGGTALASAAVPTGVWIAVMVSVVSLAAVVRLRRSVFGADPPLTGR